MAKFKSLRKMPKVVANFLVQARRITCKELSPNSWKSTKGLGSVRMPVWAHCVKLSQQALVRQA